MLEPFDFRALQEIRKDQQVKKEPEEKPDWVCSCGYTNNPNSEKYCQQCNRKRI